MTPTFPGMNPYLETPDLWTEVHAWLIVQLARPLNPILREHPTFVSLPSSPNPFSQKGRRGTGFKVPLPMAEEVKEPYLESRQIDTGNVIAVIEVLSPKNKRAGEGRDQYTAKRRKVRISTATVSA